MLLLGRVAEDDAFARLIANERPAGLPDHLKHVGDGVVDVAVVPAIIRHRVHDEHLRLG